MGTKICVFWLVIAGLAAVRTEVLQDDVNLRVLNLFTPNRNQAVDLKTIQAKTPSIEQLKQQFRQTNFVQDLTDLVLNSQLNLFVSLERSLSNSTLEQGSDVVRAINLGINRDIFLIQDDSVAVDPAQLQKFILKQTRSVVKNLYPSDLVKQLVTYATVSLQINNAFKSVEPFIADQRLPLSVFSDVLTLTGQENLLVKRSILSDLTSALSSAISSVISSLISEVLTPVQTVVSNLLTTLENLILSLYVSDESSSSLLNAVYSITNVVVTDLAQMIENVKDLLDSLFSSLSDYIASLVRKRREIEYAEDDANLDLAELSDATGLVRNTRSVSITGILTSVLSIIWKVVAVVLNIAAKGLVGTLLTYLASYITSLLTETLENLIYSLINSIFPCSSCSS